MGPELVRLKAEVEKPGGVDLDAFGAAVGRLKAGAEGQNDRLILTTALMRVAFASPEAVIAVYERLAGSWLGETAPIKTPWDPLARNVLSQAEQIGDAFWEAFGALQGVTGTGVGAGEITVRTAALGAHLDAHFRARAEEALYLYPGAAEMAARPFPQKLLLSHLAGRAPGSLGQILHDLLVRNGFDPEVLDREALGLKDLPPALRYVNARILSLHDVVHLVAGFELVALGEVAISAFQLAQFGHGYSAMFLAVATTAAANSPALPVLLQFIAEGWRHGRETPAMLPIVWEDHWDESIEAIRARYAIAPFRAAYPQDLFEQMRAQAAE